MVSHAPATFSSRLSAVGQRLDRRPALATFLLLAALFLVTADWTPPHHIDPLTNVMTAWKLGTSGSVVLDEYESLTGPEFYNVANQLVETEHGPISKYPPGSSLLAAPLYTVVRDRVELNAVYYQPSEEGPVRRTTTMELPRVWPASVVAAFLTAGAMAALASSLQPVVGLRWAWVGGLTVGLGTSLWSVAADALWQHGPAAFGIALGLLGVARGRYVAGSAGFGLGVLVRPQTAIIAAVVGTWAAIRDRSLVTLLKTGSVAAAAAISYVAFNQWAFGASIVRDAGGYWVAGAVNRSWWNTIEPFLGAFFSPLHGVLVWSPFLGVAIFGLGRTWKTSPWWMKAGAVAALLYLAVQVRGNGYVGGGGFRWYRYQLEPMVATAPLLLTSLRSLWYTHMNWRRAIILTVGFAIVAHAYAGFL